MVGLDPTIHAGLGKGSADPGMDARVERGHDGKKKALRSRKAHPRP